MKKTDKKASGVEKQELIGACIDKRMLARKEAVI